MYIAALQLSILCQARQAAGCGKGAAGAHPADVLELPGAHVVGVHDEALVVCLQQVAELGVILRARIKRR